MNIAKKFSAHGAPVLLAVLVFVLSGPAWAEQGSVPPSFKSLAPIYPGSVVVAKEKFDQNYKLKSYFVKFSLLTTDPPEKVRAFYDRQGIGKLEPSAEVFRENTQFEERHYFMVLAKDRRFLKQSPKLKFLEVHYRTPPEPPRGSQFALAKSAGNLFSIFQEPLAASVTQNDPFFDFGKVYRKYKHLRIFYLEPAKFRKNTDYLTYSITTEADLMKEKYEARDSGLFLAEQQRETARNRSSTRRSRRNADQGRGPSPDQMELQAKIGQLMQQGKMAEAQALIMQQVGKRRMSRDERRERRAERRKARRRERKTQDSPTDLYVRIFKDKWKKGEAYLEAVSKLPLYRTRIVIRGKEPDRG